MSDELALLRAIALNPYDDAIRTAYDDWLRENGREQEADAVRATVRRHDRLPDANWMTNQELIGELLRFPLDAVVLYQAYSDWCELRPGDVTLVRAEDRKIEWREQQGYKYHDPTLYESDEENEARAVAAENASPLYPGQPDAEEYRRRRGEMIRRYKKNEQHGIKPDFRTVITFPGN